MFNRSTWNIIKLKKMSINIKEFKEFLSKMELTSKDFSFYYPSPIYFESGYNDQFFKIELDKLSRQLVKFFQYLTCDFCSRNYISRIDFFNVDCHDLNNDLFRSYLDTLRSKFYTYMFFLDVYKLCFKFPIDFFNVYFIDGRFVFTIFSKTIMTFEFIK